MNHIITHYTGDLNQPGIRSFVHSLENVDADVVFFTSNDTVPDFLRNSQIRVVFTPDRKLSIPNFQRHFDILDFFQAEKPEGQFFMCDCRDLVFLGDPFSPILIGNAIGQLRALSGDPFAPLFVSDHLHVFQECGLYTNRSEFYNAHWIGALYPTALDELGDYIPICGGTIMAESAAPMLAYLRAHVDVINKRTPTVDPIYYNDQATINETLRLHMSNLVIHHNEAPTLVYTMGTVPPEEYSITDGRIWVNGYCPPVIHQYDRRDRAYGLIRERFPYWPGFPP
jgi:hypothetical protein